MSAEIVSSKHINALITWASRQSVTYFFNGKHRKIRFDEQRCVDVLFAQNVLSVNCCYHTEGSFDQVIFERDSTTNLSPLVILKACHGYAYQSSETNDWKSTEAHAIVRAIEAAAIRSLPGYAESAGWSL